jgi:hypothetical protein
MWFLQVATNPCFVHPTVHRRLFAQRARSKLVIPISLRPPLSDAAEGQAAAEKGGILLVA